MEIDHGQALETGDAVDSSIIMDWVETPAYWQGWEAKGNREAEYPIHVVVDTNVLMDIEIFDRLADTNQWNIVFCIPWIVLGELDKLKQGSKSADQGGEDESKSMRARMAIKYLEESFQSEKKSFLGQSLLQFKEAVKKYGVPGIKSTNDDLIIHCSLQKKHMDQSKPLLLLSNDKNLCLKAAACDVRAFTLAKLLQDRDKILSGLVDETSRRAPEAAAGAESHQQQLKLDSPHHPRTNLRGLDKDAIEIDSSLDKVLGLLEQSIPIFIEKRFRESFGSEWEAMVSIAPPWSLQDCFKLLRQHWWSLDLDQDAQVTVDLLVHVHDRKKQGKGKVPLSTFLMFMDSACNLSDILQIKDKADEVHAIRDSIYKAIALNTDHSS